MVTVGDTEHNGADRGDQIETAGRHNEIIFTRVLARVSESRGDTRVFTR
jgi:hypothetical protein